MDVLHSLSNIYMFSFVFKLFSGPLFIFVDWTVSEMTRKQDCFPDCLGGEAVKAQ